MSLQSKRELLAQIAPRYRAATQRQKTQILDEFVAATGYVFLSSEMGLFRTFGGAGLLTPPTPVGGGDQTWRGHTHSA